MKPMFTPGPWWPPHQSRDDCSCNCASVLSEGYAGSIAVVSIHNGIDRIGDGGNDCPPPNEAKANGFLIAAAPELYAALEKAVDWLARDHVVVTHLERALAKARGEAVDD